MRLFTAEYKRNGNNQQAAHGSIAWYLAKHAPAVSLSNGNIQITDGDAVESGETTVQVQPQSWTGPGGSPGSGSLAGGESGDPARVSSSSTDVDDTDRLDHGIKQSQHVLPSEDGSSSSDLNAEEDDSAVSSGGDRTHHTLATNAECTAHLDARPVDVVLGLDGSLTEVASAAGRLKEYEEANAASSTHVKSEWDKERKSLIARIDELAALLETEMKDRVEKIGYGMDGYILEHFMSTTHANNYRARLDGAKMAASGVIQTESPNLEGNSHAGSADNESVRKPAAPLSEREISNLKTYLLLELNKMQSGSNFAGLSTNRLTNKKNLANGGFMWIAHIVFIGGFKPPANAEDDYATKYIFTPWGLFMIKLRPFLVEDWDGIDVYGYFCYSHQSKSFEQLSPDVQAKRMLLARVGKTQHAEVLKPGTIRVVNYEGQGVAYMSKSKTQIDLNTPMRPARGYVFAEDRQSLVDQIRAFEQKGHDAFINAPTNVECGQRAASATRMERPRHHNDLSHPESTSTSSSSSPFGSDGPSISRRKRDKIGKLNSNAIPVSSNWFHISQARIQDPAMATTTGKFNENAETSFTPPQKRQHEIDAETGANKKARIDSAPSCASSGSESTSLPASSLHTASMALADGDTGLTDDLRDGLSRQAINDMLEHDDDDNMEDDDGSETETDE